MANMTNIEKPSAIVPLLRNDFLRILALGAGVGFMVWVIGMVLDRFVFGAYFCQNDISNCASSRNYAATFAGVIAAVFALGGLIRLLVYRPLLVVIASFLSMWGIAQISWGLTWWIGLVIMILLYSVAMGIFSWLARIREFWISFVLIVALIVIVRVTLSF